MRITRIYTGDDGQSHFEDLEVAFALDVGHGVRTPLLDADAPQPARVDRGTSRSTSTPRRAASS